MRDPPLPIQVRDPMNGSRNEERCAPRPSTLGRRHFLSTSQYAIDLDTSLKGNGTRRRLSVKRLNQSISQRFRSQGEDYSPSPNSHAADRLIRMAYID
jgi:hypothetical protein